jgi:hypothetical protein
LKGTVPCEIKYENKHDKSKKIKVHIEEIPLNSRVFQRDADHVIAVTSH